MTKDQIKTSGTPGKIPTIAQLQAFPFGYNLPDGLLYALTRNAAGELEVTVIGQKNGALRIPEVQVTDKAPGQAGIIIDGGNVSPAIGYKKSIRVPYSGTIAGCIMLSGGAPPYKGDAEVDIWKMTYEDSTPSVEKSICGGVYPSIANNTQSMLTDVSAWSTNVNRGDIFGFYLRSITGIHELTVILIINKTTI